jgi:hypothetical protein
VGVTGATAGQSSDEVLPSRPSQLTSFTYHHFNYDVVTLPHFLLGVRAMTTLSSSTDERRATSSVTTTLELDSPEITMTTPSSSTDNSSTMSELDFFETTTITISYAPTQFAHSQSESPVLSSEYGHPHTALDISSTDQPQPTTTSSLPPPAPSPLPPTTPVAASSGTTVTLKVTETVYGITSGHATTSEYTPTTITTSFPYITVIARCASGTRINACKLIFVSAALHPLRFY